MRSRIHLPLAGCAAAALGLLLAPSAVAERASTFQVKVKNLTAGQPLTPPVVATHRGKNQIFRVGTPASFGVKEIAENGNNAPLLASLRVNQAVTDVEEAAGGPLVPPGKPGSAKHDDSAEVTLTTRGGARRLSLATMLICTNDGFTGVNSLKLPARMGDKVTVKTFGYDARTERNSEDFADIVPPCQELITSPTEQGAGQSNPALLEGGVIEHHAGIRGGVDLVRAIHGWDIRRPVARVTVKAVG